MTRHMPKEEAFALLSRVIDRAISGEFYSTAAVTLIRDWALNK